MSGSSRKFGRNKRKPSFLKWKAKNATGNGSAAKRKVRNLMRSNGMTEAEAVAFRNTQKAALTK